MGHDMAGVWRAGSDARAAIGQWRRVGGAV
jgi:hypothetical protein